MTEPLPSMAAETFEAVLATLQASRDLPYYDAEADTAASAAYHTDAPTDRIGLLITTTHQQRPRYQPAREVYPWVDLQPDRTLRSLYTGQSFDPAELIRSDAAIAAHRQLRAQSLAALADTSPQAIAEQLDTALPYNCEHVAPQSWFGKAEPMRGDLHHLFACQSRCNSFRGNTPYAEFGNWPPPPPDMQDTPLGAVVREACGKRDTAAFEPAHGNGPAARATFYIPTTLSRVRGDERRPAYSSVICV